MNFLHASFCNFMPLVVYKKKDCIAAALSMKRSPQKKVQAIPFKFVFGSAPQPSWSGYGILRMNQERTGRIMIVACPYN
jgi:hypothetical protein